MYCIPGRAASLMTIGRCLAVYCSRGEGGVYGMDLRVPLPSFFSGGKSCSAG
jgi:hypothetical protein